jgi:hypothetical protein
MSWAFDGDPYGYTGGADNSSDVSHGFKFSLRAPNGETMNVNVEAANGAHVQLTELDARNAIRNYIDGGQTPPRRIVMDREETSPRPNSGGSC